MSEETEIVEEYIDPKSIVVDPPENDIEGVRQPVAKKIEEMLRKGRRHFGSSGAFFTHQASSPEFAEREEINKTLAKEYLEGERDTTKVIKQWMKNKPSAVLIDAVSVPDWEDDEVNTEAGIIDGGATSHALVIGTEVILIDTRRWKKKKNYSLADDGSALMTNKSFDVSDVKMRESIMMWLEYLDEEASLTGFVCVNTEEASVTRNRNWYTQNYRLVEIDRFIELLDEKWKTIEDYDRTHINSTLVSQIVIRAIKPFDPYTKVFSANAMKNFK